jgi:carotenoid cleavage dioxygenase
MNAYTDGPRVHLDFGCGKVNAFPFIREASAIQVQPQDLAGGFVRWTFDLSKPAEGFEETVLGPGGDMPRAAEKDAMRDYEIGYYQTFDPTAGPPLIAGPVGAGFNTILRLEVRTGKLKSYVPGPTSTVQEHVHIRSATPGHEGYLGFICDKHAQNQSEVYVLEAEHIEKGPLARIKVPFRMRVGVHGNWIPAGAL